MALLAVASSGAVAQGPSHVDQYHKFCEEFMGLIKAGKSVDADDLLYRNKYLYSGLINQQKPFDALIETILEDGTVEKPYVRIVKMARILENHGFATNQIRAYQLGGLIAVGNDLDAAAYLEANPNAKTEAESLLKVYESIEEPNGPRRALMALILTFEPKAKEVDDLAAALAKV